MKNLILLIDDDQLNLSRMRLILEKAGYTVHQAEGATFAVSLVKRNRGKYSLALMDYHMPEIKGDDASKLLLAIDPDLQIVTCTGDDSIDAHEANLEAGSLMVIPRDIADEKLLHIVRRYCQKFEDRLKLARSADRTLSDGEQFIRQFNMIGASSHLVKVCTLIQRYSKTLDGVLIHGESGTGKEFIAKAIHRLSKVANGPFVTMNCGAVVESVSESELFGHVKGAFTGALSNRAGLFMEADGGTIFLDEIGDMSMSLQVKLLRVLQEREVMPVGADRPNKIDVRIIAATNVNLEEAIKTGKFREDLYYRLNILPVNLLPLRNRREDIEPLALHFVDRWNEENKMQKVLRNSVIPILVNHDWPGNVRELENSIKRHLSQTDKMVIEPEDIDDKIKTSSPEAPDSITPRERLKSRYQKEEKKAIEQALKIGGSLAAAAKLLFMAKSTLYDRTKILGIKT